MTISTLVAVPASASAYPRVVVNLPTGNLGSALIALAQQANVTIGLVDPAIARLSVRSVHGRMDVETALRRLLVGRPARAQRIDDVTWRVMAAPARPPLSAPSRTKPPLSSADVKDIVITASKTGTRLSRYAGTASVASGVDLDFAEQGRGSEALVERLPALSSTHLGSGRNKLFIRGIADSSFNGPSQALVGQYLGEVRLNYNAPDPDVSLYDVQSVEVIEGPQGALYGAGSLAGVLRIVPQPVAMSVTEGSIGVGRSLTAHGAGGYDLVGIINLPLNDRIGARIVAFSASDGGYIDDVGRGLANINRTHKSGGRGAVQADLGAWRVSVGGLVQNITTDDGQYADAGLAALTRSSRIAQPFDNDYLLGSLTVSRGWGGTSLVSATAVVRQNTKSRFDFTENGATSPRAFDQSNRINLLSNETRLSRQDADGRGWLIGMSVIRDDEKLTRSLGDPISPPRILGVDNDATEAAAFGEAGFALSKLLVATIGGRLEHDHLSGRAIDPNIKAGEPTRDENILLPSLSLSWRPDPDLLLFGRYQEGFRPGGLSITPAQSAPVVQRFRGDDLASVELGAKWTPARRLDATLTLSHARWSNIQADLVDMAGLPFTANIGDGRVLGLEAALYWRPLEGLRLSTAAFANDSLLTDPGPSFAGEKRYELPNVAHFGATGRAAYRHRISNDWRIDADARVQYVGHSRLGVGPALDLLQGNYFVANMAIRLGDDRRGVTLDADNLLDSRGNMFALGDPFDVAAGRQRVPQHPRTMRLEFDARF